MFISQHPGPWQYFVKRPNNVGLNILEIKQKYLIEESKYYSQLELMQHHNNWNTMAGGGPNRIITSSTYVPSEQVIFSETFGNDGTTPNPNSLVNVLGGTYYNPPLTWTNVSLDALNGVYAFGGDYNNNWSIIDSNDWLTAGGTIQCNIDIPNCSGNYYLYMSDSADLQSEVILPAINTIGKTNIKLQFKSVQLNPIAIHYSTNGTVWNIINASYTGTGNLYTGNEWLYNNINLPVGTENKSTLYIRFKQLAGTGGSNRQIFDDFKVLATF